MADYIVKDIGLADWGRKELDMAETEMPGLMANFSTSHTEPRPTFFRQPPRASLAPLCFLQKSAKMSGSTLRLPTPSFQHRPKKVGSDRSMFVEVE